MFTARNDAPRPIHSPESAGAVPSDRGLVCRRRWRRPRLLSQLHCARSMDHLHPGPRPRFDDEHLIIHERILVIDRFRHQLDDRLRQRLELDRIGHVGPDRRAKTHRSRVPFALPIAGALIDRVPLRLAELEIRNIARRVSRRAGRRVVGAGIPAGIAGIRRASALALSGGRPDPDCERQEDCGNEAASPSGFVHLRSLVFTHRAGPCPRNSMCRGSSARSAHRLRPGSLLTLCRNAARRPTGRPYLRSRSRNASSASSWKLANRSRASTSSAAQVSSSNSTSLRRPFSCFAVGVEGMESSRRSEARPIRSARRHDVDLALGHVGQLLVGRLLFLQGLLEDLGAVIAPELLGPGDQGAIARDLIVLDGLRRGDHGRVENVLVVDIADDVILEEADDVIGDVDDKNVLDAAMIAAAQAVEHYEITRYGALIAWAKQLGRNDCAKILEQTLQEEKATDKKLTDMAESKVNVMAAS